MPFKMKLKELLAKKEIKNQEALYTMLVEAGYSPRKNSIGDLINGRMLRYPADLLEGICEVTGTQLSDWMVYVPRENKEQLL